MSRVATPHTTTPTSGMPMTGTTTSTTQMKVPHEKIAMRAYEKWCKRGCPQGTDVQDWTEAEAELRAEQTRGTTTRR